MGGKRYIIKLNENDFKRRRKSFLGRLFCIIRNLFSIRRY